MKNNNNDEGWTIIIPGNWHERETESPANDEGHSDDFVLVFEGDPSWMWELSKKFAIAEWIRDFINMHESDLSGEVLDKVFSDYTGDPGSYHALDALLGGLPDAVIDDQEYWEGPGPVSGYNVRIVMHRDKVEQSVDRLWATAAKLREAVLQKLTDEDYVTSLPLRKPDA